MDDGGSSEDEGVGEVELDDGEDACSLVTLLRAYPSAEGAELSKVRRYLQTAVAHYSAGAWKNCVLWLDAALELETGEARLALSLRVFKQIPRAKHRARAAAPHCGSRCRPRTATPPLLIALSPPRCLF